MNNWQGVLTAVLGLLSAYLAVRNVVLTSKKEAQRGSSECRMQNAEFGFGGVMDE